MLRRRGLRILNRRVHTHVKSGSIGPKFETVEQVEEFLSKPSWSINDYIPQHDIETDQLPTNKTMVRLIKLSGLPMQNLNEVQQKLAHQLSFINTLQSLPVDEGIDPNDARIMSRSPQPISYKDLEIIVEEGKTKDESLGEISGSWNSIGCTKLQENGFFVIREGLIKNRK